MFRKNALLSIIILSLLLLIQIKPASTQEIEKLPLAELGKYKVDVEVVTLTDTSRPDHKLSVSIWYPALSNQVKTNDLQSGSAINKETARVKAEPKLASTTVASLDAGTLVTVTQVDGRWAEVKAGDITGWIQTTDLMPNSAKPDMSNAPYPLILFSHGLQSTRWDEGFLLEHLASYGFVVASIGHTCDMKPTCIVDRPLDVLFVLDQLAGIEQGKLAGMIDKDNVGVTGASYGGYTALATSGARIDPEYFAQWPDKIDGARSSVNIFERLGWSIPNRWSEISAYHDQVATGESGDLWPPMTDTRIRAVLPMVPPLSMLFGDRGLAAANVPLMIFSSTEDEFIPYEREIAPLYTEFNRQDYSLLSFVGHGHNAAWDKQGGAAYKHFSTAFFGYYLQGRKDYAAYLTVSSIQGIEDLSWGVQSSE